MYSRRQKTICVLCFLFVVAPQCAVAHSKDVTSMVVTIDENAINGEFFIHGFQVARLMQTYNLNPSQLAQDDLKEQLRSYFDFHFRLEGRKGAIAKSVVDFRDSDPAQFLVTGITIIFFARLKKEDFPLTFYSDFFFEFSSTQTNKLVIRDKLARPFPGSREILLAPKLPEFAFDINKPDFTRFDFAPYDSDGDGIADQYEALYGLDSQRADTDGDGFSDFEEFFMGWDPFDANLAQDQSKEKYRQAVAAYTGQYRRKPTEESMLMSLADESALKGESQSETSVTVRNILEIHDIQRETSPEINFLEGILQKMEYEFFLHFDFGALLLLLGMTVGLGFFHAGSSGPGKGILVAFMAKGDRNVRRSFLVSLAFTAVQLGAIAIEVVFFWVVFPNAFQALPTVLYIIQISAGIALGTIAVFQIIAAIKKIREKIIAGKKTFFDSPAGAILVGSLTGLGASPFLWALLHLLAQIGRGWLVPFFFLFFSIGVFACLILVALATLVIRHIFFDILPRLILYAELVSASLLLLFAGFFFLIRIPF